jgi:hypothetical protein
MGVKARAKLPKFAYRRIYKGREIAACRASWRIFLGAKP